jgi:hypothetical protein
VRFNTTARPAKKINATFIRACSFLMCNRLSQITAEWLQQSTVNLYLLVSQQIEISRIFFY